jgi:hypothetical protein
VLTASLVLILGLRSFVAPSPSQASQGSGAQDKILSSHHLLGTFIGFQVGDYYHAGFKPKGRTTVWLFLPREPGFLYFLSFRKGRPIEVTYEVVESYIPGAGERQIVEKLVEAKSGRDIASVWWKKQKASLSAQELEKKYAPSIEAATVSRN